MQPNAPPVQDAARTIATSGNASGATFSTVYRDRRLETIPVTVDELRQFKADGFEEFTQFSIANFFVSGSFWLGMEKALTDENFTKDILFWFCVICFMAGLIIGYFGYRQLSRRADRIERIIQSSESVTKATTPTLGTVTTATTGSK